MPRNSGKKNEEVLEAIEKFIKENGISPTVRELGDMVGLSSTSTIHGHIKKLKKKNLITYNSGSPRSIRLIKGDKVRITLGDVPKWIKNERLESGLSIEEVSKDLEIDFNRLIECEKGNVCLDMEELRDIFEYYGSMVELVFY